jgi:hypothetical protein
MLWIVIAVEIRTVVQLMSARSVNGLKQITVTPSACLLVGRLNEAIHISLLSHSRGHGSTEQQSWLYSTINCEFPYSSV